jgi:hypothetical protein
MSFIDKECPKGPVFERDPSTVMVGAAVAEPVVDAVCGAGVSSVQPAKTSVVSTTETTQELERLIARNRFSSWRLPKVIACGI